MTALCYSVVHWDLRPLHGKKIPLSLPKPVYAPIIIMSQLRKISQTNMTLNWSLKHYCLKVIQPQKTVTYSRREFLKSRGFLFFESPWCEQVVEIPIFPCISVSLTIHRFVHSSLTKRETKETWKLGCMSISKKIWHWGFPASENGRIFSIRNFASW